MTDTVGRLARLPNVTPRIDSKYLLIGAPVALVVWLALVPLVFLLWQSFLTPQTAAAPAQLTLDNFREPPICRATPPACSSIPFNSRSARRCSRWWSAPRWPG